MKNVILILLILTTLGIAPTEGNTLYKASLPEVIVKGDILEGFKPKRTKTEKEFVKHNRPVFQYIARYTWLTEAQAFAFLRMEQGRGSYLYIEHNNPFNIKGKGVVCKTWEVTPNNKITAQFRSYKTLREGLSHFIHLMNTKYASPELSDEDHAKWLYKKGYFTDKNYHIRAILAKRYNKYKV